mmetsp:Transcript_23756/g.59947  ORF Transcript_23756/g.59947 Transcript_23756/m.59947 type:complete len:138 (-) Transcript_23756:1328-1741(-)
MVPVMADDLWKSKRKAEQTEQSDGSVICSAQKQHLRKQAMMRAVEQTRAKCKLNATFRTQPNVLPPSPIQISSTMKKMTTTVGWKSMRLSYDNAGLRVKTEMIVATEMLVEWMRSLTIDQVRKPADLGFEYGNAPQG